MFSWTLNPKRMQYGIQIDNPHQGQEKLVLQPSFQVPGMSLNQWYLEIQQYLLLLEHTIQHEECF